MKYSFVTIEGNIGAGKTTLAHLLSKHFDARLILEQFADNPFLPKFYESPQQYAFPLELFFMAERFKQLKDLIQQKDLFQNVTISDYLFTKCLLFAKINLPLIATYCASKAALLSLGQALRAYLGDTGVHVMTVMPTTIDTDMSKGADVAKMTTEFVAGEILRHIGEESIDPPIGEEAERILKALQEDPIALEKALGQIRA